MRGKSRKGRKRSIAADRIGMLFARTSAFYNELWGVMYSNLLILHFSSIESAAGRLPSTTMTGRDEARCATKYAALKGKATTLDRRRRRDWS